MNVITDSKNISTVVTPPETGGDQARLCGKIFSKGPSLPPLSINPLSGMASFTVSQASNYSAFWRSVSDTVMSASPRSIPLLGAKDMGIAYHVFGEASALGAVVYGFEAREDYSRIKFSEAIGDKRGALLGRVAVSKGILGVMAGVTIGAIFRPLSLLSVIKGAIVSPTSNSLLGRVTFGVLAFALVAFSVFFILFGALYAIKIWDAHSLKKELSEGKIEALQARLQTDPHILYEKMVQEEVAKGKTLEAATETVNKALVKEAIDAGKEGLRTLLKTRNIKCSDEKLEKMATQILEDQFGKYEGYKVYLGLKMAQIKAEMKIKAELERVLDGSGIEAFNLIRNDPSLAGRVAKGEKIEAIDKVIASLNKKMKMNAYELGIMILGAVTMLVAFATGPIGILVGSVMMVALNLFFIFGLDGLYLKESYKSERPKPHDKTLYAASIGVGLVSVGVVTALILANVISFGLPALIVSGVITALWMGTDVASWIVGNRNERVYREKNPTLEYFLEAMKKKTGNAYKMIQNMDETLLNQIFAEFGKHGDMVKATEDLIAKNKALETAELNAVFEELAPYLVDVVPSKG